MKLDDFKVFVEEELKVNSASQRRGLVNILSNSILYELLNSILADSGSLSEIAGRSYIHNNGFVKILLIDCRPRYAIRLHFWPPTPINDSSIHNHPWDMSGRILSGKYTWKIYSPENCETPDGIYRYKCEYLEKYEGHTFSKIGNVIATEVLSYEMMTGCNFDSHKSSFHKIIKNNDEYVDSIVVCGLEEKRIAEILTAEVLEKNTVLYNSNFSINQLKIHIESFLERRGDIEYK